MTSVVIFEVMIGGLLLAVLLSIKLVLKHRLCVQYRRYETRIHEMRRRFMLIESIALRHVTSLQSDGSRALKELRAIVLALEEHIAEIDDLRDKNSMISLIIALELLDDRLCTAKPVLRSNKAWRADSCKRLSYVEECFEHRLQLLGRRIRNTCNNLGSIGVSPVMIGEHLFSKLSAAGVSQRRSSASLFASTYSEVSDSLRVNRQKLLQRTAI